LRFPFACPFRTWEAAVDVVLGLLVLLRVAVRCLEGAAGLLVALAGAAAGLAALRFDGAVAFLCAVAAFGIAE